MFMVDKKASQSGFALLVTLIVVSVVVSVGLVLLDVTIKQLRLSSNSTDSEIAFHAANAGVECAQYWRRQSSDAIEGNEFGSTPQPSGGTMSDILCFDDPSGAEDVSDTGEGSSNDVHVYRYDFDWSTNDRCTVIDMVVAASDVFGTGVSVSATDMQDLIPGYPDTSLDCPAGSFCTVISSKGYNRNCSDKDSFGTVERDVLLEF